MDMREYLTLCDSVSLLDEETSRAPLIQLLPVTAEV